MPDLHLPGPFERYRGTIEQITKPPDQTLSQTILTNTVTLVPILCLFSGTVLRDFSLAIIIGVVVGTYSSIFIASPIFLWWNPAQGERQRRQAGWNFIIEGDGVLNSI